MPYYVLLWAITSLKPLIYVGSRIEWSAVWFNTTSLHTFWNSKNNCWYFFIFFGKREKFWGKMLLSSFMDSLSFSLFLAVWLVGCLEKALKFYWLFCFSVAFLLARKNIWLRENWHDPWLNQTSESLWDHKDLQLFQNVWHK